MTVTVVEDGIGAGSITASFRRRRPGPETELVDWFLNAWPVRAPKGCRVTVYREPRLESGFPDLVLVVWDIEAARHWRPVRAKLTQIDIRLMHYILNAGSSSFKSLTTVFSKRAKRSLEKLEEARMVRQVGENWQPCCMSEVYAVKHIVAVEAKINDWAVAIQQASLNTWFASSSYVLVPHLPRKSHILRDASSRGVGVWTRSETPTPCTIPATKRLPLSYASWLFNEWTCQLHWDSQKESSEPT
jgi:hypothetical protein